MYGWLSCVKFPFMWCSSYFAFVISSFTSLLSSTTNWRVCLIKVYTGILGVFLVSKFFREWELSNNIFIHSYLASYWSQIKSEMRILEFCIIKIYIHPVEHQFTMLKLALWTVRYTCDKEMNELKWNQFTLIEFYISNDYF